MKQNRNLSSAMATKDYSKSEAGFESQMKKVLLFCFMVCFTIGLWGQTISDYKTKAEKGDKEAQYTLGMMYYDGNGVESDYIEAFQWFEKSANQDYAPAQFMLGWMLNLGQGYAADRKDIGVNAAIDWWKKAVNQGYGLAAYHIGMVYVMYGIEDEIQKWLLKAVELGVHDAECYKWLGETYSRDSEESGIKKKPAEALKWYKKAAEINADDLELCYNLGSLYMNMGDYKNAEKWLLKVAEKDKEPDWFVKSAIYNLGKVYFELDDLNKSVLYYKKAGELGNSEACKMLGDIYYGSGLGNYTAHMKIDKAEAIYWYLKVGGIDIYKKVGRMYYFGEGIAVNQAEALKCFRKAAELGDKESQYNTGICYYYGYGTTIDKTESVKWLKKSAEQGYATAQNMLKEITTVQRNVVKMKKDGGVYTIPILVNGVEMSFIFDTGASTISISETEVSFLYKQGKLKESDIIGTARFTDATGTVSEGTIIVLRTIKIGTKTLYDIEASVVHNMSAPLLLGQSALEKFGKFTVDYSKGEIIFE